MSENNKIDLQEVIDQLNAGGNMSPELVEIFSEEAEEHMRTIYDGLDKIRDNGDDTNALGDVRRAAHTLKGCLLYTSPSPRDGLLSRMPSSA